MFQIINNFLHLLNANLNCFDDCLYNKVIEFWNLKF